MAVDANQLRRQAIAFPETLDGMTEKQKELFPTTEFGRRFNEILQLAKEAAPDVDQRLWPRPLTAVQLVTGTLITNALFFEIEAYVRQVLAGLSDDDGPLVPARI